MKNLIYILSMMLLALLASCSDDERLLPGKEENGSRMRSITFSLMLDESKDFSVSTRSNDKNGVPFDDPNLKGKYVVYLYLFREEENGNQEYILDRMEKVETSLYSIQNLEYSVNYKYLFVAVSMGDESETFLTSARDLMTTQFSFDESIFTPAQKIQEDISNLNNCFFPFFSEDNENLSYEEDLTFNIERDLEIFADGNAIPGNLEYHTPTKLLMTRQIGVVEIELDSKEVAGKEISCSVNSDYYRLYFSQMIKNEQGIYTSQNTANFEDTDGNQLVDYGSSDYYSSNYTFITTNEGLLPTFTKTVTVPAEAANTEKYYLQLYLPYTTAQPVGASVPTYEQANIVYSTSTTSTTPGVSINIDGVTYNADRAFPIHRNTRTVFWIKGGRLETIFGQGGIGLEDDEWDGLD